MIVHIIFHIDSHIVHIGVSYDTFYAYCAYKLRQRSGRMVSSGLLPLSFVPTCEGPAVDVPPTTVTTVTVAAVMGFVAGRPWKIGP